MSNNPAQTTEWKTLQGYKRNISSLVLTKLFEQDDNRFENCSQSIDGLLFDYSKQNVTPKLISNLCELARARSIEKKRDEMFSGTLINTTEKRPALHTALRRPITDTLPIDGKNIIPEIHATLEKMKDFSEAVRSGEYKSATGQKIIHVICLGTGGSGLGPHMVNDALRTGEKDEIKTIFVSNIDGNDIQNALQQCEAENTLVLIISKSFTTQETLANALYTKAWLQNNLPAGSDISKHLVGVSCNQGAAIDFGITTENFFSMEKWTNGRFSLWSSVGLAICLQVGFSTFRQLLDGAHVMDQHFQQAPLEQNIPVLMALIGIWNRNFLSSEALAILPYAQSLLHFPAYIQQLEMESNGKSIDLDNQNITDYKTCPVIFGEVGTNGQHSFYQLLHQGSDIIPCDFIGFKQSPDNAQDNLQEHHTQLMNNMLAQGQALMQGHTEPDKTKAYQRFDGNRPSSTLVLDQLDAYHLGLLIALYEHKCFVQGVIWNINSFDQFGVELGKQLSYKLDQNNLSDADSSTKGLFSLIHKPTK